MINFSDIKENKYAVIGSGGYVGKPLTKYLRENLGLRVTEIEKDTDPKMYKKGAVIFFVAVPTPTSNRKFNADILHGVINKIPDNTLVVIRSTVPAWVVKGLILSHPQKTFVVVPEFLDADTATLNFLNPYRLVVGVERPDTMDGRDLAKFVLKFFPGNINKEKNYLMSIEEACLTKYAANAFFLLKNVFFNQVYELAALSGMDHKKVLEAITVDPRIGKTHAVVPHKGGRGAGGGCLVKDFEVFMDLYKRINLPDGDTGQCFLKAASELNRLFLFVSNKNPEVLKEVFG